MTHIIGQRPCPSCGSEQDIKDDGRKYYLSCKDCGTMTHYQSKAAKARIESELFNAQQEAKAPEDNREETEESTVKEKAPKAPKKNPPTPVRVPETVGTTSTGFFSYLDNLFDNDEEEQRA